MFRFVIELPKPSSLPLKPEGLEPKPIVGAPPMGVKPVKEFQVEVALASILLPRA